MWESSGAKALFFEKPHEIVIRSVSLAAPQSGEAFCTAIYSGVSRGTEALVFRGQIPESEYDRMRAPFQHGEFPFPVGYGYAWVGVVAQVGPDTDGALLGRRVFALHPHQTAITLPLDALIALPDAVPSRRATLAANLETALNALWDSGAGPGDRIAVVGVGGVGALIATLAARLPGAELLLVDPALGGAGPERAALAATLGATACVPETAPSGFGADVVFHASATESGLATALALAGREARVVEVSWYGAGRPAAPLGAAFHAERLSLISSQVGQVAPSRRPRWSHRRRLAKAVEMLADDRYEQLLGVDAAFDEAPTRLPDWLDGPGRAAFGAPTLCYPATPAARG